MNFLGTSGTIAAWCSQNVEQSGEIIQKIIRLRSRKNLVVFKSGADHDRNPVHRPGTSDVHHRVSGKPRSTVLVDGSGQRLVTTLPRV